MKPHPIPIRNQDKKHGHTPAELQAEIRRRAYELYQQKGCTDSDELQDWLQAEAEVLEREHH